MRIFHREAETAGPANYRVWNRTSGLCEVRQSRRPVTFLKTRTENQKSGPAHSQQAGTCGRKRAESREASRRLSLDCRTGLLNLQRAQREMHQLVRPSTRHHVAGPWSANVLVTRILFSTPELGSTTRPVTSESL